MTTEHKCPGCDGTAHIMSTPALREGDIILNAGMHILITGPARIHKRQGSDVYAWPGRVLNADDVCKKDAYIRSALRGGWDASARDTWPIQGNHLATWCVVRPE